MGLPSKRRTKQSKRERAAHFALKPVSLVACSKCKRKIRPHQVCPFCGYYRGKDVLKLEAHTDRKRKKAKKLEDRAKNR